MRDGPLSAGLSIADGRGERWISLSRGNYMTDGDVISLGVFPWVIHSFSLFRYSISVVHVVDPARI